MVECPDSSQRYLLLPILFPTKGKCYILYTIGTYQPNDPGVAEAPPCVFISTGGGVDQEGPAAIATCG